MKHFIGDADSVVTDALETAVMLGEGKVARLDGFPAIKVIVRTDHDPARVAVISGGGSGHEPAHAGFVGDGMLTAAVCGEIFASPSVDAVLAGILAVTGPGGCLLVVKSYTGDRLNFGLAAERARAFGLDVEMIVVSDDIAIPGVAHPRGVAGTLFVHKVAGHLARAGASLAQVKEAAERVAKATVSIGLSLSTVSIPGRPTEDRIGPGEVELGLGIHGEPGAEKISMAPVSSLVAIMTKRIDEALGASHGPIALLLNDLGGVPPLEMAVATRAILAAVGRPVKLVFGPGRLMTSLDMKGISISALPLDAHPEIETALSSAVGPGAWLAGVVPRKIASLPLSSKLARRTFSPSAQPSRRRMLERVCSTLVAMQAELDSLDARVGDGDTGTTFATAARSLLSDLDTLPFADAPSLCAALSDRLSRVMGGSSGVLLAIFTAAMGTRIAEPADWAAAMREGARKVQQYGGAKEGDRTMLDALLPAITAIESGGGLAAAAAAAAQGADRTATMSRAAAGRSSYVREDALRGVPDPGAVAVAKVLAGLV